MINRLSWLCYHREATIAKAGHENLDFGQGFYVTDIKEQAERWAFRIGRQQQEIPLLNIYQLDLDEVITDFSYLKFSRYDEGMA